MACRKEVIVPNNLKEDSTTRMFNHPCQIDVQPHNTDVSSKDLSNTSNKAKAMGTGSNSENSNTGTTSSTSGDEGGITDPNDDEDEAGSPLGSSAVINTGN